MFSGRALTLVCIYLAQGLDSQPSLVNAWEKCAQEGHWLATPLIIVYLRFLTLCFFRVN